MKPACSTERGLATVRSCVFVCVCVRVVFLLLLKSLDLPDSESSRFSLQPLRVYLPTAFCSGSCRRRCWTRWTSKDSSLCTAGWSNTCRTSPKRGRWSRAARRGVLSGVLTSSPVCQEPAAGRRSIQRGVPGEGAEVSDGGRRLGGVSHR